MAVAADTTWLSLEDAIRLMRENSPVIAAAEAESRSAHAAIGLASPAFLPSLSFDAGAVRTTDPVAVFGMKLRQENFQAADLSLDPLNRPDPYGGYTLRATVQQPIFAPEGIYGFRASRQAALAQDAFQERTAGSMVNRLVRVYRGAQLARATVATLEAGYAAALSHADQAEALRAQGLTTGLDARIARVKAAEVNARLITAKAQAENAIAALRSLLAMPPDAEFELATALEMPVSQPCQEESCAGDRGDLRAAAAALEASNQALKSAWASNLPAVFAFGSIASYNRSSPIGGSGDWTVGIGVKWTPFRGTAGIAAVTRARATRDVQEQRFEALTIQAELERTSARRQLEAAKQRFDVADDAVSDAAAALEQAELRYRTGVSTITELLDVQAAKTTADLNRLAAIHDVLVTTADVNLAYGVFDQ